MVVLTRCLETHTRRDCRQTYRLLAAAEWAAVCVVPLLVHAQTQSPAPEFPIKGKPMRVIVAFSPGIGVDAHARAVTPKLAEILGVQVLIDNKPGGGTLLAAQEVTRAALDGYTIFYSASSTMAQIAHTLRAATYDPMTEFTPITIGARGPLVVVVHGGLPVRNSAEPIAYGKANPGK